ncbi:hypothetical protein [Streptomyces sp. NBC_01240]|uniref:hypothetical protein n=1 Tax=Streptomyces sp. NBC_01240 TaxID=2903793 RepID=UPI002E13C145|nr:hypothetical protein OG466_41250 [Streptomyces sp. NBC_01240]
MTAAGEDLLAVHPAAIAEAALRQIHDLADQAALDEIRSVAVMAVASIDMHRRSQSGRARGRAWLAKMTSAAFPRCFTAQWNEPAKNHLCFTVQITEGVKNVIGRPVEVQVPDEDAERLARQILRLIEWRKQSSTKTSSPDRRRSRPHPVREIR